MLYCVMAYNLTSVLFKLHVRATMETMFNWSEKGQLHDKAPVNRRAAESRRAGVGFVLPTPASLQPRANPIENPWIILKCRLRRLENPQRTAPRMRTSLLAEWAIVCEQAHVWRAFISNMNDRVSCPKVLRISCTLFTSFVFSDIFAFFLLFSLLI